MKYFNNVKSEQQAKKLFLKLSKKLHPDLHPGIDDNLFKEMNNEYLEVISTLRNLDIKFSDIDQKIKDIDNKQYVHKKIKFDFTADEKDILISSVSNLLGLATNRIVKKFINKL